jgi:hypothetical protein
MTLKKCIFFQYLFEKSLYFSKSIYSFEKYRDDEMYIHFKCSFKKYIFFNHQSPAYVFFRGV